MFVKIELFKAPVYMVYMVVSALNDNLQKNFVLLGGRKVLRHILGLPLIVVLVHCPLLLLSNSMPAFVEIYRLYISFHLL